MGMSAGRVKQMADILNGKAHPRTIRPEKTSKKGTKANATAEKKGA